MIDSLSPSKYCVRCVERRAIKWLIDSANNGIFVQRTIYVNRICDAYAHTRNFRSTPIDHEPLFFHISLSIVQRRIPFLFEQKPSLSSCVETNNVAKCTLCAHTQYFAYDGVRVFSLWITFVLAQRTRIRWIRAQFASGAFARTNVEDEDEMYWIMPRVHTAIAYSVGTIFHKARRREIGSKRQQHSKQPIQFPDPFHRNYNKTMSESNFYKCWCQCVPVCVPRTNVGGYAPVYLCVGTDMSAESQTPNTK